MVRSDRFFSDLQTFTLQALAHADVWTNNASHPVHIITPKVGRLSDLYKQALG
jgi:hypothetical protein